MDKFFGLDRVSPHSEDMELVETAYDNVRLAIVRSILDGENIPYVVKYRGSNAVTVLLGTPAYGADIFVEKERIEDARAALSPYEGGVSKETEESEDDGE